MKIQLEQLNHLRKLITPDDRKEIAKLAGCSKHTLKSILYGDRFNPEIEFLIYAKAKENWSRMNIVFRTIERENHDFIKLTKTSKDENR